MTIDPITVEVIRNALAYSSEEAGIALRNAAYSHNIKERMDHSCALFDFQGNLLAQAEHIPVHLGSLPWGIRNVIRIMGNQWTNGDVVIVNDPYVAGTHLNDVTLVKPVFFEGFLTGFSVNKAHHVDIGGDVPGSISSKATSLSQEGVILPPVKLLVGGRLDENILNNLLGSVRNPDITLGDLRAQIAAVNLGERSLIELARKYGHERLLLVFHEIISHGRRRMTDALQTIPKGIYRAEDCLENVAGPETLSWIRVEIERTDNNLRIDFTGTDPEIPSPFNAVFGVTLSASYFAVKSIVDPEGPMNEGVLQPIRVIAPEKCLLNPKRPSPVSGGNLETSQRIADAVFKALAQALPDRVPAASHGSMNNVNAGGFDSATNRIWTFCETLGGGSGARPGLNGVNGIHCNMTNTMNTPIEAIEQYYPVLFQEYELRPGTGGDGEWQGGLGLVRAWKLKASFAEVTVIGERQKIPPWGLNGGSPGRTGRYRIRRANGIEEVVSSKTTLQLRKGDTLIMETPGGGGFGRKVRRSEPEKTP